MGKPRPLLVIACLLALGSAAPARAGVACYQHSNLPFFQQVVEIVEAGRELAQGCWVVRLRLRGKSSLQGHGMACGGNACGPQYAIRDSIYWREASAANENILRVTRKENGSCTDVTFCIVPEKVSETLLVDFAALYEENFYLDEVVRPRWSDGVIDLSSFDGTKSHCQDGEPRGAVCL